MMQDKDPFRRIHATEGATETAEPGMIDSTRSASAWDAMVERLGGSLVQSWGWGELHRRHGFRVERILIDGSTGPVMAQILIRRRGPVSVAYLPRGPLFMDPSPAAEQRLFAAADDACQRHRTLVLTVEPPAPLAWSNRETGFVPGERRWHHSRTVKIPLLDDDALLAQMRGETRRRIRQAPRRGVVVEQSAVHPE